MLKEVLRLWREVLSSVLVFVHADKFGDEKLTVCS